MTTKVCTGCKEEKPTTFFHKKSANLDGLQSRCKDCCKLYNQSRTSYPRLENVIKQCITCQLTLDIKNFPTDKCNKDGVRNICISCSRAVVSTWKKENPDKNNAKTARHRATKGQATAKWANKKAIAAVYKAAADATKLTGITHHVDHEHPLKGDLVCGLHHELNLVVEPASYNCSKSNRFSPYREHGFKLQVFYPKYVLVPGWTADDPDHPYGYFI